MRRTINLLLGVMMAAFCCFAANAQFSYSNSLAGATLIYSNNFTIGAAGVNISNTAPTVANGGFGGTNTATWTDVLGVNDTNSTGPVFFGADGTVPGTPDSILLPFTPQSNYVYTLTASLTFSGNPGNWVGAGFAQRIPINAAYGYGRLSDGGSTPPKQGPNGYDWMILSEGSGNVQFFKGAGGAGQMISQNGFFPPGAGTHQVQVILDTTRPQWALAAFVDGVQASTNNFYPTGNPTIGAIGLTENSLGAPANMVWNSFALSATPIVIGQEPASASVGAGAAFTNTVVVAGVTPSYQWYNNGVAITDATNASLVINPISPADAGTNYYVVVTNVYGAVTSAPASLTVYTSPVFTGQSPTSHTNPITLFGGGNVNGTNYFGSSPTFSVSALGGLPLAYQWLTNGVAVSGATNASFTLTNCQLGGPTNFACIVSNTYGAATNNSLPAVVYAPAPSAPFPQAVLSSQPAGFWRLNEPDNGIGNGNAGVICNDYQSGNNGIYTNVALGQTGSGNFFGTEPTDTSAGFGQGGLFDSYADQIQGLDFAAASGSNAEFTVEAWANCGSGGLGGGPVVTQGTNGANEAFALGLDTSATPNYQFYVRSANGTVYKADSSVPAADFTWHHLVGICDEANGNVSLYVDGKLAASTNIPAKSGILETAAPLSIGGEYRSTAGNNLQFLGSIDDVAVYNYALAAAQVANHYAAETGNSNAVPVYFVPPTPPGTVVFLANTTFTIPVTVSGQAPLGYYWTNVTAGGVLGSGQTTSGSMDATLTIPNASTNLSGDQLELVATNGFSSTNLFVTLFSPAPPVTLDYSSPILYSNYFDGGTWSIAGMPMTAANSLVGGTNTTWTDALGTNDTGSLQASGVDASTLGDSWVVPFTPHAGYVYTVTASLTFSGNPGSWVGLGFAQRVPTNAVNGYGRFSDGGATPPQLGPNGYDWMILTEGSGNVQCFMGPRGSGQVFNQNGFFTAGSGTHMVQIVLDTTGSSWTTAFYVDGVQAGTTQTYGANPPIGAVGLTQNGLSNPSAVQWTSFAVSQEAPGGVPPYVLDSLPTSVTLLAGSSLSIPATAFGSAPFGYYWSNTNTAAVLGSGSTNNMAPLGADLGLTNVPASWNGNTLALTLTNAFGTNISLVTLTVTNAVNTTPTNIVFSVAGNQMTLSWPADHTGWTLQAQTNALSVGLGTNWVDVVNSVSTNQVDIPISTTNGSVFYRLILK